MRTSVRLSFISVHPIHFLSGIFRSAIKILLLLNDKSFCGRSLPLPYDLSISVSFGFLVVFVLCILAPETGLGTDIYLITGQLSRQSYVLTLVADRQ